MDFNYNKIRLGNWLFKNCFPLYNIIYTRFKLKNDREEIDLIKKLIQPGDVVLDIGGNIGFYAQLLSRFVGEKGKVFSFEPDLKNFNYLKQNTHKLRNVQIFNAAVSHKKETLKIYTSKLLNVDHRTYPVNNYDQVNEINAVSIDDLIAEKIISTVNVIKIDIQGYELAAFTGMQKLLQTNKNLKILAEYWPHGFKRAGTSAIAFYEFFDTLGYEFFVIEKDNLKPLDKDFVIKHNDEPFEFSFNVLVKSKTL